MKTKNIRRLLALSIPLLCVAAYTESALAASLAVKIRQIDPAGNVQTITCAAEKKCELPLDIKTKAKQETVTVGVMFTPPGSILFTFQTPEGFLYTGDKNPADKQHATYGAVWLGAKLQEKPTTSTLTLFGPREPNPFVATVLNTPQEPVADLEITVEAAP